MYQKADVNKLDICLRYTKMKAYLNDNDLELKLKEFKLLAYLIANKNKVVMKDEILNNVWRDTYISDGALNVQISRLRDKIEKMGSSSHIKTVWAQGYIYETNQ